MSTRQTRQSAAKAAAAQSSPDDIDVQASLKMNGNGSAHPVAPETSESTEDENIFLFWPNIIGTTNH